MCKEREIAGISGCSKDDLISELERWREENAPDSKIVIPDNLSGWDTKLDCLSAQRLRTECAKRNLSDKGSNDELVERLLEYKAMKKEEVAKVGRKSSTFVDAPCLGET